jgi:hypothetical protein
MGYISADQLEILAMRMKESSYGQYILEILDEKPGSTRAPGSHTNDL